MKNRKLTKSIRKLILLLLALVVLFPVLSGCQSSTPPSQEASYAPLSDAKITEIKKAWEANPPGNWNQDKHNDWDLTSKECYYGTYGDCVVIFDIAKDSDLCMAGTILVADLLIHSPLPANIFVYRSGEFAEIQDAYRDGWLTKEQIQSMQEYHKTTSNNSGGPDKWPVDWENNSEE